MDSGSGAVSAKTVTQYKTFRADSTDLLWRKIYLVPGTGKMHEKPGQIEKTTGKNPKQELFVFASITHNCMIVIGRI